MDSAKFSGTEIKVDGNLKMTNCTANAFYENQDSEIRVYGDKADIINCDFQGIAKTLTGEKQVYLGNGMPMIETFTYNTMSGVSLFFGNSDDLAKETTLNFKGLMVK